MHSWHADDVVQTPHVASRPFFFSMSQVICLGKVRFSGTNCLGRKRRTNNSNCVVVHVTLVDGVTCNDRDVLALCRMCTRTDGADTCTGMVETSREKLEMGFHGHKMPVGTR